MEIGVRVKNPIYPRLLSLLRGPGFRFAMVMQERLQAVAGNTQRQTPGSSGWLAGQP